MTNERLPQQEEQDEEEQRMGWIRISALVIIVGSLAFIIYDACTANHLKQACVNFLTWVQHNPTLGVVAVIIVYAVGTILFVPGSLLTVGAGFAFGAAFNSTAKGVFLASLSVFVGAFLGSTGSFLLGRYLFRGLVVRLASRYAVFQAVDKALEGNGLKIMVLLRLSPLIPYNALDYLSGITSISLRTYCLGLIAILPGVVMFTFLGATASSLISSHDEATRHKGIQIFSFVFGVFFAVLGVGVASYYSKIELDNILENEREGLHNMPLNGSEQSDEGYQVV